MSEAKRTIKERIKELGEKHKISDPMFVLDVMDLIERGAYPKNFCPDCQERMLFDNTKGFMLCINCGYEDTAKQTVASATATEGKTAVKLPAEVEKMLADKPITDTPVAVTPKNKGAAEKIKALRNKIAGTATPADEDIIRGQDKNIRGDINWS